MRAVAIFHRCVRLLVLVSVLVLVLVLVQRSVRHAHTLTFAPHCRRTTILSSPAPPPPTAYPVINTRKHRKAVYPGAKTWGGDARAARHLPSPHRHLQGQVRVRECESARVRECESARVRECERVQ
jgi:hypothetical protein